MTEKLLAYAIGRRLEYHDRPAVRKIVRDAAASDYRWSSLVMGIVNSPAFLMRASRDEEAGSRSPVTSRNGADERIDRRYPELLLPA